MHSGARVSVLVTVTVLVLVAWVSMQEQRVLMMELGPLRTDFQDWEALVGVARGIRVRLLGAGR